MKHNHYIPGKHNPHLPHDGVEIEPRSTDTETAQRNADLLVSQLMQGKTTSAKQHDAQTNASDTIAKRQTLVRQEAGEAVRRKTAAAPDVPPEPLTEEEIVRNVMREAFPPLQDVETPSPLRRVPPVYLTAIVCGLIVFIWPTLLFWMLVMTCVLLFAVAGLSKFPGVATVFATVWRGFARRAPQAAERMRQIADRVAIGVERVLDVLPGSLADRLSLPDFSQPVSPKR
ncbi:MAG: hypothetical protein AAFY25_09730 [Pseudomonadota bacterium]